MSSTAVDDEQQRIYMLAIDKALKTPELVTAAKGLLDLSDIRPELANRNVNVWDLVEADLLRWRQRRSDRERLQEQLVELISQPIFSPTGIWQRIRSVFVNKRPPAMRARISRFLDGRSDYRDLREAESVAIHALIQALVERAVLPYARALINERSHVDNSNNVIQDMDSTGLDQLLPDGFELQTSTKARCDRLLNGMTTASIGIAGPRGAGKTTLLNWYCGSHQRKKKQLNLLVTAPVRYEARDYLLYILIVACREILAQSGVRGSDLQPRRVTEPDPSWLPGEIARSIALALGLAVAFLGIIVAFDVWLPMLDLPPSVQLAPNLSVSFPTGVESAIRPLTYLILLELFLGLLRKQVASPLRLAIKFGRPQYSSIVARFDVAIVTLVIVTALAEVFVVYALFSGWTQLLPDRPQLLLVLCVILGVLGVYVFGGNSKLDGWDLRGDDQIRAERLFGVSDTSRLDAVIDEAASKLERALFQQALSSSTANRYGISASFGVTVSADTTTTTGATRTTVAWTRPELVHEIRELLGNYAASRGPVLIGIDELDKIATRAEAASFIDDIKAIFGVPHCYFLVSVSEDALSDFERRGLPLRTAFDSAFDEVIELDCLTSEGSQDLLRTRVIGMPMRFIALCHALSGGHPRDLIRVARRLFELGLPVNLADAAKTLVVQDLDRKSRLLAHGLSTASLKPWTKPIVDWIDRFQARSGGEDLMTSLIQLTTHLRAASAIVMANGDDDERRAVLRLSIEFGVFAYFCATVAAVCCNTEDLQSSDGETAAVVAALDGLARARQGLAVHPELARARIDNVRRMAGWAILDAATS